VAICKVIETFSEALQQVLLDACPDAIGCDSVGASTVLYLLQ